MVCVGVGIGEVIVVFCVYLLIGDYFFLYCRVIVLGIYVIGLFIGGGVLLFLGSMIV